MKYPIIRSVFPFLWMQRCLKCGWAQISSASSFPSWFQFVTVIGWMMAPLPICPRLHPQNLWMCPDVDFEDVVKLSLEKGKLAWLIQVDLVLSQHHTVFIGGIQGEWESNEKEAVRWPQQRLERRTWEEAPGTGSCCRHALKRAGKQIGLSDIPKGTSPADIFTSIQRNRFWASDLQRAIKEYICVGLRS